IPARRISMTSIKLFARAVAAASLALLFAPQPRADYTSPIKYRCCWPEAVIPPSISGCTSNCMSATVCSEEVVGSSYYIATCALEVRSNCVKSAHTFDCPQYVCTVVECDLDGEPGAKCHWEPAGSIPSIGLFCDTGSDL